jgi:hypothetical protein
MPTRWRRRPPNACRNCGYSWYPRGRDVFLYGPRCKSQEVEVPPDGYTIALGYLIYFFVTHVRTSTTSGNHQVYQGKGCSL